MNTELSISHLSKRLEAIEHAIKEIRDDTSKGKSAFDVLPSARHLASIREMFLLEIIRDSGLLEKVDLEKIKEKVRLQYGAEGRTQEVSQDTAINHLERALREISEGDYSID